VHEDHCATSERRPLLRISATVWEGRCRAERIARGWTWVPTIFARGCRRLRPSELHHIEWGSLLRNGGGRVRCVLECGDDCEADDLWRRPYLQGGPGLRAGVLRRRERRPLCGTIGQVRGTLECGASCPKAGWTCDHNMCKGDSTCKSLTCVASSATTTAGRSGTAAAGRLSAA